MRATNANEVSSKHEVTTATETHTYADLPCLLAARRQMVLLGQRPEGGIEFIIRVVSDAANIISPSVKRQLQGDLPYSRACQGDSKHLYSGMGWQQDEIRCLGRELLHQEQQEAGWETFALASKAGQAPYSCCDSCRVRHRRRAACA